MSKISSTTLGNLIEFQRGYDLPQSSFQKGKVPVIASNGILGYHNEYKVIGPGITIGRSGTVGLPHFIKENFFPHNTSLFVKDFKGNDPKYIFYLLKNLGLNSKKSGSSVPTMNRNHLHPLTIRAYLDVAQQKKIAAVLSALDNKIELNNRINTELENLAKTIYDYWFVQFDFPDKNGKPYKASGGKMVYNQELKRSIPKGWEVKRLGEVLKTTLGGTPSTKESIYWDNGDIPWLNSSEVSSFPVISSEKFITQEGLNNSATTLLPKGSIVISIVRYIRPSILAIDACANQSVLGIYESKKLLNCFIYPYLVSQVPRLMSLRTGAQQPHINKETVDQSLIIIPEDKILSAYYNITKPLFNQITNIAFQNQQLTELRDWLLPMLMNGQVTVK